MEKKYLLGFSLLPNFGPVKFRQLSSGFFSFNLAWHCSDAKTFIFAGLSAKYVSKMMAAKPSIDLEAANRTLKEQKIEIVSENDPHFSQRLKEIPSPPYLLFCRGNIELLNRPQIAVVGTRRPTGYGRLVVERLVMEISQAGLVVTSGLAQGTDANAHRVALDNGCQTIAVLGNGLDDQTLGQGVNAHLAREILNKGGLLVSEYPPGFHASKITFPARNRIISGLSLGVLVIEAGDQSGTLITARHALEQNRDVFAVPGNIFSEQSQGTHQLIRQGAMLTTSANDILEALHFSQKSQPLPEIIIEFDDETQSKIFKLLSFDPMPIDQLIKRSHLDAPAVNTAISMLEIKGAARATNGGIIRC